jgi:hypothetical protein
MGAGTISGTWVGGFMSVDGRDPGIVRRNAKLSIFSTKLCHETVHVILHCLISTGGLHFVMLKVSWNKQNLVTSKFGKTKILMLFALPTKGSGRSTKQSYDRARKQLNDKDRFEQVVRKLALGLL